MISRGIQARLRWGQVSRGRGWHRLVVLFLVVLGCQEPRTTVTGSVSLDGKPLTIREGMRGTVVFQPEHDGPMLNGNIGPDGTYRMAAGSSSQVKPGTYQVIVSAVAITPPTESNPLPSSTRITPAKFASAAESGLRVEVLPGPNDIDLSLTSATNAEDEEVQGGIDGSDKSDQTSVDEQPKPIDSTIP